MLNSSGGAPYPISVVIPTYQRRAALEWALSALARQSLAPDLYETIVVIDGSEDGTRELIAQFPAPYKLLGIWQPNQGRAAACNKGIRSATGELIVLLDDDMEAVPGFLEAHLRTHTHGARLGVLGAVPVPVHRSSPPVARYVGARFDRYLERLSRPGYRPTLGDFYSGNFSIRRRILLEVGLFDETFKMYGNEDLDLLLRLSKAGVEILYNPEALAYQHYLKDFAQLARDTNAEGQTAVLLASKHPETFYNLGLVTYRQAPYWLRLLRSTLIGLSRVWGGTPRQIIAFVQTLERLWPARPNMAGYSLALDYFYWLGVQTALDENRRAGRGLTSLSDLIKELSTQHPQLSEL